MTFPKLSLMSAVPAVTMLMLAGVVAMPAQTAPAPLFKTGQTKCWDGRGNRINCNGSGQDGDVKAGISWPVPRFQDNRDGTVTDRLTNLIWLRQADCYDRQTWAETLAAAKLLANGKCGLTDASRPGDWRMPNIIELRSIIDFGTFRPALPEGHPFANFEPAVYWSSSSTPAFPSLGWFTTMGVGPHVFDLKVNKFRMLPIRGGLGRDARLPRTGSTKCYDTLGAEIPCLGTGQDAEYQAGVAWPNPRFTENGDGTVRDNLTGLLWLKNAHCFGFQSWTNGLKSVNGLEDGKCGLRDRSRPGDWRLPNIRELQSIMDNSAATPAIPAGHPFVNLQPTLYWTSTSGQNFPLLAFFSLMSAGSTVFEHKNAELGTWAIKGGSR